MKIVIYILILQLTLSSCGSFVYQSGGHSFSENSMNRIQKDFDITTKVLDIRKKSKENNEYIIDYEITNHSDQMFSKRNRKYFVFFIIKTKSGREIGHYKQIYDRIHPATTILKNTIVNLSTYLFDSISASIYIE